MGVAYGRFSPHSANFNIALPISVAVSMLNAGITAFGFEILARNRTDPSEGDLVKYGSFYGFVTVLLRSVQFASLTFALSLYACTKKELAVGTILASIPVFVCMTLEPTVRDDGSTAAFASSLFNTQLLGRYVQASSLVFCAALLASQSPPSRHREGDENLIPFVVGLGLVATCFKTGVMVELDDTILRLPPTSTYTASIENSTESRRRRGQRRRARDARATTDSTARATIGSDQAQNSTDDDVHDEDSDDRSCCTLVDVLKLRIAPGVFALGAWGLVQTAWVFWMGYNFSISETPDNNYANSSMVVGSPGEPQFFDCHERGTAIFIAAISNLLSLVLLPISMLADPHHGPCGAKYRRRARRLARQKPRLRRVES